MALIRANMAGIRSRPGLHEYTGCIMSVTTVEARASNHTAYPHAGELPGMATGTETPVNHGGSSCIYSSHNASAGENEGGRRLVDGREWWWAAAGGGLKRTSADKNGSAAAGDRWWNGGCPEWKSSTP